MCCLDYNTIVIIVAEEYILFADASQVGRSVVPLPHTSMHLLTSFSFNLALRRRTRPLSSFVPGAAGGVPPYGEYHRLLRFGQKHLLGRDWSLIVAADRHLTWRNCNDEYIYRAYASTGRDAT